VTGGKTVSGLYQGQVRHARFRPRVHRLRQRIFMTLLDLDELPALDRRLKLFGHNRPGLIAFHDKDHLAGSGELKAEVSALLDRAGMPSGGRVRVLCMPRVLGFVFNPISVYFCHRADGLLIAMLYEVNNTFGQRHSYLIPVVGSARPVRQTCSKKFHVSPFMDMAMRYHFVVGEPDEEMRLIVDGHDDTGPMIAASFRGKRAELTDKSVMAAFLAHPLLSLAVLAGIHWEAIKLLAKGLRLKAAGPAPAEPVSLIGQSAEPFAPESVRAS
jgi:DUF1365 family protein